MNAFTKAALLVIALAALFAFPYPAVSITSDLVVTNGDSVRQELVGANAGLGTVLGGIVARIVVEYANSARAHVMAAPAPVLLAQLLEVGPRARVGSAESTRQSGLAPPASVLEAQLDAVGQHIILRFAERSTDLEMQYPVALLQDRQPPAIGRPTSSGAHVQWTTNEFTASHVRFGASEGDLNQSVVDLMLQKVHTVTLAGMGPGVTIYCQITSTDQSGNATTSPVYQVAGTRYLYLPAVER
jgi:hypothetical protein